MSTLPTWAETNTNPGTKDLLLLAGRWIWRQILLDNWYVGRWHRSCVAPLMFACVMRPSRWTGLEMAAPPRPVVYNILKVIYIKAELFWLGLCQHTFIWSERHREHSFKREHIFVFSNIEWHIQISVLGAADECVQTLRYCILLYTYLYTYGEKVNSCVKKILNWI